MNCVALTVIISNEEKSAEIETKAYYENVVMVPMGDITFLGYKLSIRDYCYQCSMDGVVLDIQAFMTVPKEDFEKIKDYIFEKADVCWEENPSNIIKNKGETVH